MNQSAKSAPGYEKEYLKNKLKEGVWLVSFTKKDGTDRVIKCTRDPRFMPKELRSTIIETKTKRKESATIPVWDVNKCEWRSFTADQVYYIEGTVA